MHVHPVPSTPVVEVLGHCGAGKTTMAEKVLPVLRKRLRHSVPPEMRPEVPSGWRTILLAASFGVRLLLRRPHVNAAFVARPLNWRLLMKLAYRTLGMRMRDLSNGAILLDAGVLQPFVSFQTEDSVSEKALPVADLLDLIPLPDAALFVDVDPETAQSRYVRRETACGRAIKGTAERFARAQATLDSLKVCLHDRGVRVLALDMNLPRDADADNWVETAETLEQLWTEKIHATA